MGKRVMVTGAGSFLGRKLVASLDAAPQVEHLIAVDVADVPLAAGRAEFMRADLRTADLFTVLERLEIDTVVHADLTSRASGRGRSNQKEQNILGTMKLLAACQRLKSLRSVIVRSSTAIYGSDPTDPSILREERSSTSVATHGYSRDVADAETVARDFGRRRPEVALTVLRYANVVGPTADSNMTQFFSLPLIPTALGFDPRLQMLHEDDAVEVLVQSVIDDHPGVFNVAADGVIYLSQAIRLARKLPLPVPTPLGAIATALLRRASMVDFPEDQISLIMHGRVVDTSRLRTQFGYVPRFTTERAFRDFVASGSPASSSGPVGDWEKQLYEFAARKIPSPPQPRPRLVGR